MDINKKRKKTFIFFIILLLSLFFSNQTFASQLNLDLKITSEAAILIEEKSGRVLFEKNADQSMYPASLTKIATAIYAIEKGNLEDIVTVSENARYADGTRVYLDIGEKVPLKKLIQGLIINSGNDAGVAIAEHLDGTIEKFAVNLNAYLQEIGLENTNFVNPHGLFDSDHVTTARGLALITQYAMKNAVFQEIFGEKELKWVGDAWDTTLYTHHKLMREQPYEGITGGKTGFVNESRHTLVTTAKRGDLSVIAVVLKGESKDIIYQDTIKLLDYAFANYKMMTVPADKEYFISDKKFFTKEAHTFPINHSEEITDEITNDGLLKIKNQFGENVISIQLNEQEMKIIKEEQAKEDNRDEDMGILRSITLISSIILALFFITIIRKRKLRLRKFW